MNGGPTFNGTRHPEEFTGRVGSAPYLPIQKWPQCYSRGLGFAFHLARLPKGSLGLFLKEHFQTKVEKLIVYNCASQPLTTGAGRGILACVDPDIAQ